MDAPRKPPTLPEPNLGTLEGKYALLREIGSGGTGTVYEAEDLVAGNRVAVKVFYPLLARSETLRARFVGETRAASQIGHENVVDIHDFGVSAEGSPFLVMDLLDGETLEQLMERRGALPPTYACELMAQLLAGLGAAHATGVVHRNLKPANVIVTHPDADSLLVKIVDFGVAAGAPGGVPRSDEGLMGTPRYLSPEQALAKPVDERADLYAAGVILYEMLAGEAPFTGSAAEVLRSVVRGEGRPLASVNPAVPRQLAATVALAMATDAADRIRSAHEFAQRLTPYLSHPPPHSVPHGQGFTDAFFQAGGGAGEVQFLSDVPGMSRPPRDFPSFDLAKIAGKPRGEPIADSMLQSPIFPRAPAAAKIQLFSDSRDLEGWSEAPPRRKEDDEPEEPSVQPSARKPTDAPASFSFGPLTEADPVAQPTTWHRAAWVTAFGVSVGAALAWLYGLG